MRIALFGPPGAGKGTQAGILVENRGLVHISTGVIIRKAMKADTAVGKKARKYVQAGQLVPDEIVQELAEDAIQEAELDDFVLDGFPRTVTQAKGLTAFLDKRDVALDAVLSLHVSEDVIVDRLSKRRVNKETGENYHLDNRPPPDDVPDEMIVQRRDDKPEAVKKRLEVYRLQTEPVEKYYEERGELFPINAEGSVEEVAGRIEQALEDVAAERA